MDPGDNSTDEQETQPTNQPDSVADAAKQFQESVTRLAEQSRSYHEAITSILTALAAPSQQTGYGDHDPANGGADLISGITRLAETQQEQHHAATDLIHQLTEQIAGLQSRVNNCDSKLERLESNLKYNRY